MNFPTTYVSNTCIGYSKILNFLGEEPKIVRKMQNEVQRRRTRLYQIQLLMSKLSLNTLIMISQIKGWKKRR